MQPASQSSAASSLVQKNDVATDVAAEQARVSQRLRARAAASRAEAAEPLATGTTSETQQDILRQLSLEVQQLETSGRRTTARPATSSGCPQLDSQLPDGGYARGTLVEFLRMTPACGAGYLAFAAAAAAMRATDGFLVVVDTLHNIYPPALAAHSIPLAKVIFVRPESHADAIWSTDQALRTPAVAAVVAELDRIDDRAARRLQLAAESGAGLALLLRSAAARKRPSWAEVQWLVRSSPVTQRQLPQPHNLHTPQQPAAASPQRRSTGSRYLQVQLARLRGGKAGANTWLKVDASTGQLQALPPRQAQPSMLEKNRHVSKSSKQNDEPQESALHLATQLAGAKDPSRKAAAG